MMWCETESFGTESINCGVVPDAEKTVEMREEDERLLQELLEVVEQRDALVAMLDDDRVK